MGTISISYSALNSAATATNNISTALTTYHNNISSSVKNKLSSVGGSDPQGYISSAEVLAQQKMTRMSTKSTTATNFKKQLSDFVTVAQNADDDTAQKIKDIGTAVVGKRTFWQGVGDWIYNTFCVDITNSNPARLAIANAVKWLWNRAGNAIEDVHRWFKYKGGKYVWNIIKITVGVVVAIGSAIIAIATAGTILAVIAAIASVIIAIIAVINGAIGIYNNRKAQKAYEDGELGKSRYYGEIESLSDAVSKYDMGDASDNKNWEKTAQTVDTIEAGCEVVVAINGAAKLGGVKDPKTGKVTGYSWDAFKKNVKDASVIKKVKTSDGSYKYRLNTNAFTSRQDGTHNQYLRNYLGFGESDDIFYNKNVIKSMASNPSNSTQSVKTLYDQLSTSQKITKTVWDTAGVIDKTMNRVETPGKIKDNLQTIINGNTSAYDKVKAGVSAINSTNSALDFMKGFKDAGSMTKVIDKGFNFVDQIILLTN